MIASLNGSVEEVGADYIILTTGGVGYQVWLPKTDLDQLSAGKSAKLYIAEHIREDAHDLYGFVVAASRQLFTLLVSVSGVGPKLALSIMSQLSVDQITAGILANNADGFESVSGVGKRTAAKIVIELKNKLSPGGDLMPSMLADNSTYQALRQLGYSAHQAQTAMAKLPADLTRDEDRLKAALKQLAK